MLKPNVGGIDRVLRIVIGVALFLVSFTSNSIGLWGVLGVIPLISGWMRFCPLYAMLGVSTCARAATP